MWDFISQIIQAALPSVVSAGASLGGQYLTSAMAPKPQAQSGFQGIASGPAGVQGAGAGMRSMGLQSGPLSGGQPLADNSNTYNQGSAYQQAPGQGITLPGTPKRPGFEGI